MPSFGGLHGNDAGCFGGLCFELAGGRFVRTSKGHLWESMSVRLVPLSVRLSCSPSTLSITVTSLCLEVLAIIMIAHIPDDTGSVMMMECSRCWNSLKKQWDTNSPHVKEDL